MNYSRLVWPPVLSFFAVLLIALAWVHNYDHNWRQQRDQQIIAQAAIHAVELERHVYRAVGSLDLLAGILRINRGDASLLEPYIKYLQRRYNALTGVVLAPNGEVPLNAADLFAGSPASANANLRDVASTTVRDLPDGRRIFVSSVPVYLPDAAGETWWGYVAVVLDLDRLLRDSGLYDAADSGVPYRILDNNGEVIHGSLRAQPVASYAIKAPGMTWQLQLGPVAPYLHAPYLVVMYLLAFVVAALTSVSVYFLVRQPEILQQKVAQKTKELHRLAYYDLLTGLENRKLFQQRLSEELGRLDESDGCLAVLYLDVDNFKRVNDSLGHSAGDAMLRSLAERLRAGVRRGDSIARVGGDEFTVILSNLDAPEHAALVARKLLESIRDPIRIEGQDIFGSVSIGITIAPEDGVDADELMKNADLAMYHAKSRGRNNFRYYNRQMNLGFLENVSMENELRRALGADEFGLEFQPLLALGSRQIIAMEALLRWRHPDGTTKAPRQFISIAEETGLIIPLGRWVMREAMCKTAELCNSGLRRVKLSLNLSPRQLRDPEIYHDVQRALADSGLDPRQVILEITEDALIENMDEGVSILKRLKASGVAIAIDDFGTGYASLTYLKKIPVDIVKIDREFVRDIPEDQHDAEIVASVINMTHKLRLNVVAEGIERPEQLQFLIDNRCDMGQGFLFQDEEEMLSIWLETAETGFRLSSLA